MDSFSCNCANRIGCLALAALLAPIAMYLFDGYASYVAYCLAGTSAIFYLHRANIVRLRQGTEPTVGKMQKRNTGEQIL
jgi:glycerol-3-phosphate acyltransferase PlsY